MAGLVALADGCETHAAVLAAARVPSLVDVTSTTPSAFAVRAAHVDVTVVGARFAARMQANAVKFASAATEFETTEVNSAARLSTERALELVT
jgi:ferric-dicitrate binding protein FerR (iron transport regulator)